MEKILETAIFCTKCDCIIKDEELSEWECAYSCATKPWENVEFVMRSKKDDQVSKALHNLNRACERICRVDVELDEY